MNSPTGEATSMGEYAERLKQANNVCNALQTQVNSLQGNHWNLASILFLFNRRMQSDFLYVMHFIQY